MDINNEKIPVLLTEDWLRKFISKYYKDVFKKEWEDIIEGKDWIKLKHIEKTLEGFKKSLTDANYKFKWFLLK